MSADRLVAPLFVVLWSTGFVGAKLGLPYAEPMTYLALRFGLAAVLLGAWVWLVGAPWPTPRQMRDQAGIGVLVHVLYLGGVFVAIAWGLEAGVSALIVGLQPVATALFAWWFLGERLRPVQWAGLVLGFAGVVLVVLRKLEAGLGDPGGVAFCVVGLLAISLGSILQKRQSGSTPMRGGNAVQFFAAALLCGAAAFAFEDRSVDWTPTFIFALGWQVLVLSLGAITLLYILIRRGAASEVASLFFLVPPCTALLAWAMFGETLGPIEVAGMTATALGVLMVVRPETFGRRGPESL